MKWRVIVVAGYVALMLALDFEWIGPRDGNDQALVAVIASLLAGLTVGKWRVLLVPILGLAGLGIAGAVFGGGGTEPPMPLGAALVILLLYASLAAGAMGVGVAIHIGLAHLRRRFATVPPTYPAPGRS
jgi:hypothetical protein